MNQTVYLLFNRNPESGPRTEGRSGGEVLVGVYSDAERAAAAWRAEYHVPGAVGSVLSAHLDDAGPREVVWDSSQPEGQLSLSR